MGFIKVNVLITDDKELPKNPVTSDIAINSNHIIAITADNNGYTAIWMRDKSIPTYTTESMEEILQKIEFA